MEVIYSIGARFAGGGIGTTAYNAVRAIARNGYLRKLYVTSHEPTEIDERLICDFILAHRAARAISAVPLFRAFPHRYSLVKDNLHDWHVARKLEKCDIFHGWGHYSLLSLRKAKQLGAVTVVERASSHILTQSQLLTEECQRFGVVSEPIDRRIIDKSLKEFEEADYVFIPSKFVEKTFLDNGFDPSKLVCIPFGTDVRRFRPAEKRDEVFRVLFVGQVSLRKGIQYLLKAWSELGLRNAELLVVGPIAVDAGEIVSRVSDETVKFAGGVKDPLPLFQSASAFVFPSIEEGSALVTYEAMACGLPVVVSENAGSVARDGVDGFVVPIRSVEALKEKIMFLYDNPELREQMGASARRRAEEFTWDRYGAELVAAYRRIVERDA